MFALELPALLAGSPDAKVDDPALHPLARISAILSDLERWHAGRGERDAALEAKLAALRALSAHLTRDDQRAAIRGQLVERLAKDRKLAWWSMGMADLAQMHEQVQDLVSARNAAREGAAGKDPGAQKCRAIQAQLEAPDYQLNAITSDSAKQRSIEVTHKNLPKLYFRAYAQDLERLLGTARDWNLLPNTREAQALLSSASRRSSGPPSCPRRPTSSCTRPSSSRRSRSRGSTRSSPRPGRSSPTPRTSSSART